MKNQKLGPYSISNEKRVEGIRICCSGRLEGAEIARTECSKYGKTSRNVFNQKIDYASAEVSTRYGILGVKVWIILSIINSYAEESISLVYTFLYFMWR